MKTISVRRPCNLQRKHSRFDDEVCVTLFSTERRKYDKTLAAIRNILVGKGKASSINALLPRILQLRRICSHGIYDEGPRLRHTAAQKRVQCNKAICSQCSEDMPLSNMVNMKSADSGEPQCCRECAADQDWNLTNGLPMGKSNFLDSNAFISQEDDISTIDSEIDITSVLEQKEHNFADDFERGTDIDMDIDPDPINPESSSKIQAVINNLLRLEQNQCPDSLPMKR